MSPFPTGCFTLFDVRQDPTRRPNFLLGNYPRPPSGERLCGVGYLAYVVERHASACLRTVGVDIWMWKSAIQEETLKKKPFNLTKVLVFFAVAIRQTQLTLVYLVKSIKHVNFTRHLANVHSHLP